MTSKLVKEVIAWQVSGEWIEELVQFHWEFPGSGVECEVWGEVREVHHNLEGVTLWLANPDEGSGDKTGFTIPGSTKIKNYTS